MNRLRRASMVFRMQASENSHLHSASQKAYPTFSPARCT